MRALIVEDDIIIQLYLENILIRNGFQVIACVDNGDEALSVFVDENPDLVFMDIGINGDKDGVETAEILKTKYNFRVIFVTGNTDHATLERAKYLRPIHIISKPIDEQAFEQELLKIKERMENPEINF